MIHHLRVGNLGVLEDASIDPGPGFSVITGETGAGKTMLLGALRLLTGEKAKVSAVGPFGDEAVAEGLFGGVDGEIGVTRVVPREARSRAYIDGTLAASAVLEERIGGLLEIVGQHDRLLLQRSQTVLGLVDDMLDGPRLKTSATATTTPGPDIDPRSRTSGASGEIDRPWSGSWTSFAIRRTRSPPPGSWRGTTSASRRWRRG